MFSRRRFLKTAVVGAATFSAGGQPSLSASSAQRIKGIGLQLYTLRKLFSADPAAVLHRISKIGYEEVEFAGLYGNDPKDLRAILDDAGLVAPSMHVTYDELDRSLETVISDSERLGCRYVVLPWLHPEQRKSLADWRALAKFCNRVSGELASAGLRFCYHHHDFEFETIGGAIPFDILLVETDPAKVFFQIDFYWAASGRRDILKLFRENRGRFPLAHLKDMAKDGSMADVGAGTLDFSTYLGSRDSAGLRHVFVERDDAPAPYYPSVEASFRAARDLIF